MNDNSTTGGILLEINFCQHCGHRLSWKKIQEVSRRYCVSCDRMVFLDPKVAVVVLVSIDGKLVLVRRSIQPAIGRWSFPSGYVDRGEMVEDGAIREVREETGLEIALTGFVGLYSSTDSPIVLAVYRAHALGGTLQAGSETHEVGLFHPDELPSLPFPNDYQILKDWQSLNRQTGS